MSHVLDWLYPVRCGVCGLASPSAICQSCLVDMPAWAPRRVSHPFRGSLDSMVSVYEYSARASQAVRRLKFDRITPLATPMAQTLAQMAESEQLLSVDAIVPVPIHWRRLCQRGFNQSDLLCEAMPPHLVQPKLLKRIRATRPQVGLDAKQRRQNLLGAFFADPAMSGKRILLVDDTVTSGGTAEECAKTLKMAGAVEVTMLTFCTVSA